MSEIKVNKISPRTACGTTTLGDSGDTFTIPSGVTLTNNGTATGFGATGAVNWNTTKITADPNPAVSGVGYFADTSSAAFTVTLPATPSAGDIVGIRDYAQTFATNNLTIGRNSQPIDGLTNNLILTTNGVSTTLVYVDVTQGWKSINSNEVVNEIKFVTATGGTESFSGDYKIHTFTGPGTFLVSCAGNPLGSELVDYLVVAGGGSGGAYYTGGGGGAGGYRESSGTASGCYSVSPLGACVSALPVSAIGYSIVIGAGAPGVIPSSTPGINGVDSSFSTITSAGGGGGAGGDISITGLPGGSGGGGSRGPSVGGTGNTPPVTPSQGSNGGAGSPNSGNPSSGGGGGGATVVGSSGVPGTAGAGGTGATSSINGTPTARAGGGAGGTYTGSGGTGGIGGGGNGANCSGGVTSGSTNTGGGGGGIGVAPLGTGAGGSGIVIIRYKYQ